MENLISLLVFFLLTLNRKEASINVFSFLLFSYVFFLNYDDHSSYIISHINTISLRSFSHLLFLRHSCYLFFLSSIISFSSVISFKVHVAAANYVSFCITLFIHSSCIYISVNPFFLHR